MCLAIKYVHNRKILHRDIKAQVKLHIPRLLQPSVFVNDDDVNDN